MPVIQFIKKLTNRLQDFFSAAAFAEAGEPESARQIIHEPGERLVERKQVLRHDIGNSKRISAS